MLVPDHTVDYTLRLFDAEGREVSCSKGTASLAEAIALGRDAAPAHHSILTTRPVRPWQLWWRRLQARMR